MKRTENKRNSQNGNDRKKTMYLNPKADLTFKKVFGEHKHLMISFLNALLPLSDKERITDVEYLTPELVPDTPVRKNSYVDVRCKDSQDRKYIVEMQMHWNSEFKSRVLFNAAKVYVQQGFRGKNFNKLKPVWSLNLVNSIFEPGSSEYYHHYKIVNIKDTNKVIRGLQMVFVELPKFRPDSPAENEMKRLWLRFMTEIDESTLKVPPELASNAEVSEAVTQLRESAFTPDELYAYDSFWDAVSCETTLIEGAKEDGKEKGLAEGKELGRAEGKEEGLAEGIQIGIEQGRMEERQAIARELEARGFSPDDIARITGAE